MMRLTPGLARLRGFRGACAGVAAIEFAFIAPVLIFFYLGLAETCQLIMAQRRVSHTAAALSDLVTQDTDINSQEMLEIFEAGCTVMNPFLVKGGSKFRIRITSVKLNNDPTPTQIVAWSENNGTAGITDPANNAAPPFTVSTPLSGAGSGVIVTEVSYDYRSSVKFLFDRRTLTHKSEMRPRRSQEVTFTTGTSSLTNRCNL